MMNFLHQTWLGFRGTVTGKNFIRFSGPENPEKPDRPLTMLQSLLFFEVIGVELRCRFVLIEKIKLLVYQIKYFSIDGQLWAGQY